MSEVTPKYEMVPDPMDGLEYVAVREDEDRRRKRVVQHSLLHVGTKVSAPTLPFSILPDLMADLTIKSDNGDCRREESRENVAFFANKRQAALLTPKEKQMLTYIGESDVKVTAKKMRTSRGYLYRRLHLIRRKIMKSQEYLDDIADLCRTYPRLLKYLKYRSPI